MRKELIRLYRRICTEFDGIDEVNTKRGERMSEARAILTNYHALTERQYVGDTDAIVALLDFATAVERAQLTERQSEALRLVYGEGMTQVDAGAAMGISRQAAAAHTERALAAIQEHYEKGRNNDDN